jgi:hypothetical protein
MISCNWTCVDECAKVQVDLGAKTGCLETCSCYNVADAASVMNQAQFDYS